jgi:lauroyl/myristoyl acyltransferase
MTHTDLISTLPPRPEPLIEKVRRRIPTPLLPLVVRLRSWVAWCLPSVRADARRQMRFLLESSRPQSDIEKAARQYVGWMVARAEQRWHPELVTRLRVKDIERLKAVRDEGHGAIISFMHHAEYDGGAAALAREGVTSDVVVYASSLTQDAAGWLRQHLRLISSGGNRLVSTEVGAEGMMRLLQEGRVLTIAADVPGNTPVTFVGRTVLGPSGAARLSLAAGAPVVLVTFEVDAEGPFAQVHEPLRPQDFASAKDLLAAIVEGQERAVLARPEALDLPLSRWRLPEATT